MTPTRPHPTITTDAIRHDDSTHRGRHRHSVRPASAPTTSEYNLTRRERGNALRAMLLATTLLASFALAGTVVVALIFDATATRIADNQSSLERARLTDLLRDVEVASDPLHEIIELQDPLLGDPPQRLYVVRDSRGQPSALVFTAETQRGYNGRIALLVALRPDGQLLGARVTAHRETPGLGDAIERERSSWIDHFAERSLEDPTIDRWTVRRDGGAFDQFTGATITPRAVTHAIRDVLLYHRQNQDELQQRLVPTATDETAPLAPQPPLAPPPAPRELEAPAPHRALGPGITPSATTGTTSNTKPDSITATQPND